MVFDCAWNSGWLLFGWSVRYPYGLRYEGVFSAEWNFCLAVLLMWSLWVQLYEMTGKELRLNKIDSLLGPGMNIHRNPLNGRNFEYISEDPLLTGRICAAQVKAMAKSGIGSTIKHFCGNNQEVGRSTSDSVMSERCSERDLSEGI